MLEEMFKNVGKSIKQVAKAVFVVEVIVAIIGAVYLLDVSIDTEEGIYFIWALASLIGGFAVAWLSSLMIYGFGELVDIAQENSGRKDEATGSEWKKRTAKKLLKLDIISAEEYEKITGEKPASKDKTNT